MVIGVSFSGVLTALLGASLAIAVGHPPVVVALVYCLSGLAGSTLFVTAAMRRNTEHMPGRGAAF